MKSKIIFEQIRTILGLTSDMMHYYINNELFKEKYCRKFLIRQEYQQRQKDIIKNGYEIDETGAHNKYYKNIIYDLSIKYNIPERTIKDYVS